MSLSALTQWNDIDHAVITNLRFRYEYQPNSEFFVAYTEGRQTYGQGGGDRSLVVKLTSLFNL